MNTNRSPDASDQELAEWAERDMVLAAHSSTALRGAAAAAAERAMLEDALGGPEAVDRAQGGRPPLNPTAPIGEHSPKRQVRLPVDLDARLTALAQAQDRRASDVMRDALTAYLDAHPVAS